MIPSILSSAAPRSTSKPKAVGLIEILASILWSAMASKTASYSRMKKCVSSRELISSPNTSTVKHAPCESISLITLRAWSRVSPAT